MMTSYHSKLSDIEKRAISRWKPYIVKTNLKKFLQDGAIHPTLFTLHEDKEGFFVPEENDINEEFNLEFPIIETVLPSIRKHIKKNKSLCVCLSSLIYGRMMTGIKRRGSVYIDKEQTEKMVVLHFETKGYEKKDIRVYVVRDEWKPPQLEYHPAFSGDIDGLPNLINSEG